MPDDAAPELADRRVRVLRGVLASSTATVVALASHLAAGGSMPVPAVLLAVLVLSWLPGVALIGRRLSLPRQAAVIGISEAALHAAFAVPVLRAVPAASGYGHHGAAMTAGSPMSGMIATPGMWAGHALAAMVTVVAWRHGERAVVGLVGLVRRGLRVLVGRFALPRVAVRRGAVPVDPRVVPARSGLLTAAPRRGPPVPA